MDFLCQDITFLQGVGPRKAALLNRDLEVFTFEDLLHHFPYRYIDRSKFYKLSELHQQMDFIQIKGHLIKLETVGDGRKKRLVGAFSDGEQLIELVWFKGIKFILDKYKIGLEYVVFGRPALFNGRYNIVHPEIDRPADLPPLERMGFQPFYHTSEKMKNSFLNSKAIQKLIYTLLPTVSKGIPETLPSVLVQDLQLLPITEAYLQIHNPQNSEILLRAKQRFKFEELFYLQLHILKQTKWREQKYTGIPLPKVGTYFNAFFYEYLPFELTNAQKRVIKEIRQDMKSGRQMNRLLQGDVGSGKTLVALMCMLLSIDNGYQACIMAPTEILATQHYETIKELLNGLKINISLLTGSTKKSERTPLFKALENGETHLIVGTHALLEKKVKFKQLGLVVIDEQHRFGVVQRAKLWTKNSSLMPHILVMTATPIPRTLAMTVYGDLSVSVIDELPPGRKPITTKHYYETNRNNLFSFLQKEVEKGRQIYVVYPLIQESENLDFRHLEEGYEYLQNKFPSYKISMVHGKMKPKEKEEQMQMFANGKTQILVATTVIEVGVNVPNASVMIIESAERFGLSQLHQLRGRVGRGAEQSYCILLTGVKLSATTRKRLEIMVRSNDGFKIAEEDLQLRGPGDLEGTMQSGIAFNLKIASLTQDGNILARARKEVLDILEKDPNLTLPENKILDQQLKKMKKENINWGAIS